MPHYQLEEAIAILEAIEPSVTDDDPTTAVSDFAIDAVNDAIRAIKDSIFELDNERYIR